MKNEQESVSPAHFLCLPLGKKQKLSLRPYIIPAKLHTFLLDHHMKGAAHSLVHDQRAKRPVLSVFRGKRIYIVVCH
jgi:hypothetical protein